MRRRLFQAFAFLIATAGFANIDAFAQQREIPGNVRADLFFSSDVNNNSVGGVKADKRFPGSPDKVFWLKFWEWPAGADDGTAPPNNVYDYYYDHLSALLVPKATADYVFFISSDDPSELWLSTDDKEANAKLIAAEPSWNGVRAWVAITRRPGCPDNGGTKCENRSDPIHLEAGKRYFMETFHSEGLGGDNVAVTWIKKGDPDPANGDSPMTGDLFVGLSDSAPNFSIGLVASGPPVLKYTEINPPSISRDAGQSAKFAVLNNGLGADSQYQWLKNGSAIAGATSDDYTTDALQVADNGAKISVKITAGGKSYTSKEVTLTVLALGPPIFTPGIIKFDYYAGITGNSVQNLLDDATYPSKPFDSFWETSFDSRVVFPDNSHEGYGSQTSGLFVAPETGQYEFFIRSDDASQLFLSTDDKAANLQQVAEETGCCNAFQDSGATQTSAPISLTAGKRYFIQALHKEGTGGDYVQVAVRKVGDPTAAADLKPISGGLLGSMIPSKGSATITKQPVAVTAAQNDLATFTVEGTTTHGPMTVTWQRNGSPIAATGNKLVVGPLKASDNGAKYKAVISAPGAVAESTEVALTVTDDKTPPTILKAFGSDKFTSVTVVFSEAVTASTATVAGNYSITSGLTVSAVKQTKPDTVVLTTSKQPENTAYTLTVKNVTDTASTPNVISAAGSTKAFSSFKFTTGLVKWEYYGGIAGNSISNLTDSDKYKNEQPDEVRNVNFFEGPTNYAEAYGSRIYGWVVPKTSGKYQFFMSTDDNGELWLSTDDSPANKALIASEPTWNGARSWVLPDRRPGCPDACENRSGLISLQAGKRYYIELLQKEGGGGDNDAVTWRLESDPIPNDGADPLKGDIMGTYVDPAGGKPTIATAPADQNVDLGAPVTLKVAALGSTPLTYQWQRDGKDIKGAVNDTLSISSFSATDIGRYVVTVKNGEGSATSATAQLMVPLTTKTGALYIEAEDFDFDSGKYITDQPIGMGGPYKGGLYQNKGAVLDVDYHEVNNANDQAVYRPTTGVEAGKLGNTKAPSTDGLERAGFSVEVNHIVGWNDAGDWYNYTRQFPAQNDYYVVGRLADGDAATPLAGELDLVTAGAGTKAQTVKKLGAFNAPITAGWDTFAWVALRDDAGNAAKVTLGGLNTVRFTTGPAPEATDINYLLFIPAGPGSPTTGGPKLAASRNGANFQIDWTGAGTLQSADDITGPWTDVANAKSPFSSAIGGNRKFYRLKQ